MGSVSRVSYRCSREIRSFTDQLLGEVTEFMDDDLCAEGAHFDGGRQCLNEAMDELFGSCACYGTPSRQLGVVDGKASAAIPVVAKRVAIPTNAGTVDPSDWLPPERREVLDEIVPACHRVSRREEAGLIRKLLDHNMVTLMPEGDIPRTASGKLMTGGFFCVKKNNDEDRLIFDRRPENATMRHLKWAKLPSGACFARLLLAPDEYLRGSGDDLRTYYYSLALPDNWVRYNSVGRRVDPEIVASWGGDPTIPHRAAMRVLGMGDTNACCVAQGVHEHILQQQGLLLPETKLVYGTPLPDSVLLEGAYLDDLLVVLRKKAEGAIPLDGSFEPAPLQATDVDMEHLARAERAYEAAGLERALHKSFRGESHFKAWGAEIDGIVGTAGAPLAVRRQVFCLVMRVIAEGRASTVILQRLMGYLCFCFQYRRELYALQHHIYKYIESMYNLQITSFRFG